MKSTRTTLRSFAWLGAAGGLVLLGSVALVGGYVLSGRLSDRKIAGVLDPAVLFAVGLVLLGLFVCGAALCVRQFLRGRQGPTEDRLSGYLATILATVVGTVGGGVMAAKVGFFVGLALAALNPPWLTSEWAVNFITGALATAGITAGTAAITYVLVEQPRLGRRSRFTAGRRTVVAATTLNGLAVLTVVVVTLSIRSGAMAAVIGAFWAWPVWFIGVGLVARWVAVKTDRAGVLSRNV